MKRVSFKNIILIGLLIFALAGLAFLPYRVWLEQRLEQILESKGLGKVELTIAAMNLHQATLQNITFGNEEKISLKNIDLQYSLEDLWNYKLSELALSGLTLNVRQGASGWNIAGLEHWSQRTPEAEHKPFAIPASHEELTFLPFRKMKLTDSILNVAIGEGSVILPFNLQWKKTPEPKINYSGENSLYKLGTFEVTAATLKAELALDQTAKQWNGNWAVDNMAINGLSIPVPALKGGGKITATAQNIKTQGELTSEDKSWQGSFEFAQDFAKPENSNVLITKARMPWKEGRIDIRDVKIPLTGIAPIKVVLHVKSVSIEELMQSLTGGRVTATGKVTGDLPITIARNGKITVLPGTLKSEGPGVISMSPDAIPGDNEQVGIVRQILEDLQYSGLSVALKNDGTGKTAILLSFEGNNPAVYEGRPVKLNVNLTGDVLEFIEQNILLLGNPEQFIEQGIDEKK